MHTATAPVSYPVAQGGLWRLAIGVLRGLAAASFLAWLAWHGLLPMSAALFGGLAVAGQSLRRRAVADRVEWNGQQWRLNGTDDAVGAPRVMMDVGRWMLLSWPSRVDGSARSLRWFPMAAADDPAAWHRLRLAVMGQQADDAARPLDGVSAP